MNKKAKELGLKNTNFTTPHGLDEEKHFTTAYELAIITDYALKNEIIREVVGTKSYIVNIDNKSKKITNTNELLGTMKGIYGVKTGFTNGANRCLVTATKKDDMDIICVVLGADTKKDRTKDSIKLIEYAFNNYKRISIIEDAMKKQEIWKEQNQDKFHIIKGETNNIKIEFPEIKTNSYIVKKDGTENIDIEITAQYIYIAPVKQNTVIGKYIIKINEQVIEEGNIYLKNEIKRKSVKEYIKEIFMSWGQYLRYS